MKIITTLLLLAGTGAIGLAAPASQPTARINRTTAPPVIDGNLDDPGWKPTVAIADFLHLGTPTPAREATIVRFAYDDEYLYVAAECEESLLNLATQKTHEVRTSARERDGKVFEDDSVLLILRPAGGDACFEFAVNPLGTLADARSSASALWAGRNPSWNSRARVAATVHDGSWSFEMAIPWSDFPGARPSANELWSVVLARVARGRDEYSSWNPSRAQGIHTPEAFGTLVFGNAAPGLEVAAPLRHLEPGRNPMKIAFHPSPAGPSELLAGYRTFKESGEPGVVNTTVALRDRPLTEIWTVTAGGSGLKPFAWSVRDAGTLQPLYVSPVIQLEISEPYVTLHIGAEGGYRVAVNGDAIASGNGSGEVRLPLRQGANTIAVEAEKGTAALGFAPEGTGRTAARWRFAPASTPDAMGGKSAEGGWSIAPEAGTDAEGRSLIGKAGKPAVFRHTLLYRQTRNWPTQRPAIFLASEVPQFLTFTVPGVPGMALKEWTADLSVPSFLKVLAVSGFYGNTLPDKVKYSLEKLPPGDDPEVARYRITADRPLRFDPGAHQLYRIFQVAVKTDRQPEPLTSGRYVMSLTSQANGATVTEAPSRWELAFLPPLRGRQPRSLNWWLWGGTFGALDNEALRTELLSAAQAAGFNEIVSGDHWTTVHGKKYGIRNHTNVYFKPGRIDLVAYLKEHPEARLTTAGGQPSDHLMCTSALLGERWPAAAEAITAFLEKGKTDVVSYDYEYPPFNGPHSCYCPDCLEEFRRFAKLGEATPLPPEEIREKHGDAWVDFMARRVARLFGKMKAVVNAQPNQPLFSVYSGYQTEKNPAQYGVDWQYVAQENAVDIISCGYGRPLEAMQRTAATFQGKPVVMGALLQPYLSRNNLEKETALVPLSKANLLRLSLDTTGGLLVYDRNSVDGRTWYALAETSRLVADHEALFLRHRLEAVPGADPVEVQMLRDGKKALVCVMNPGGREAQYTFRFPEGLGNGREYYSGAEVRAGAPIKLTLPAGETAAYLFEQP
ncbi:MAG TPA: sugar-binding protein [Chthoniobacteraceae bacterium]|nr:sugar-binding protein [Chthoniobacteraceae bacterium]